MIKKYKLSEIANVTAGQSAPQGDVFLKQGTPFIRAGSLIELLNGKSENEFELVSDEIAQKHKLKLHPTGTILFAKSGMSCMKGYVYKLRQACYVVSHLACITPNEKVLSNYLQYYFNFNKPNKLVKDESYPSISLEDIKNLQLYLHSLPEQQRIADELDTVCGVLAKQKKQYELLGELIKSKPNEMFEDGKFELKPIKELVTNKIVKTKKEFEGSNYIKYIDISSIDNSQQIITKTTQYKVDKAPSRAQYVLKQNDILISTVRPNLRNVAIVKLNDNNLIGSTGFCVLRCSEEMKCEYLFNIVSSEKFANKLMEVVKGANYPAVSDNDIKNILIPLPPLPLQQQFADFVTQVEQNKAKLKVEITQIETLYRALLQKYFGEGCK